MAPLQSAYWFAYRDNGVNHPTLKEVQLIVKYFDLDNDGALRYPE